MRYRITVRGSAIAHRGTLELRGYFDGDLADLGRFADAIESWGVVVASPADDDYNPFLGWSN